MCHLIPTKRGGPTQRSLCQRGEQRFSRQVGQVASVSFRIPLILDFRYRYIQLLTSLVKVVALHTILIAGMLQITRPIHHIYFGFFIRNSDVYAAAASRVESI
jgi:hypothetical protein